MNYVGEKPSDPITFSIYPDDNGSASTTLYEDDGLSPAYKQGAFRRTSVNVSRASNGLSGKRECSGGPIQSGAEKVQFCYQVGRPDWKGATVADDGRARQS